MTELPRISLVLPVLNEMERLPSLLTSLIEQDYPPELVEVLIADGGSTDGTRQWVLEERERAPLSLQLIDNPGKRSGPGRNAGVAASSGEVIVFIDGHCHLPSRFLLRDTVRLFEETEAICLCRPQPLLATPASRVAAAIAIVRASALGHGRDSLIYDMQFSGFVDPSSSGASYLRGVFGEIGMYDENFDACEDVDFNMRVREAELASYTDPSLAVYYEPRRDLKGLLRQMIRYGRGRTALARKHRGQVSLSQFAPLILLGLWFVALPALLLPGWLKAIPWLLLLPYIAAVAVSSLLLAHRHGKEFLRLAPAIYLIIHLGLGAGMLLEAMDGLRARAGGRKRGPVALARNRARE